MEVSGQRHAPGRLIHRKENRYPFYMRKGGPQGRSGRTRKSRPHRDSIPGPSSPYRVAIPTELSRPLTTTTTTTTTTNNNNNNNNNDNDNDNNNNTNDINNNKFTTPTTNTNNNKNNNNTTTTTTTTRTP